MNRITRRSPVCLNPNASRLETLESRLLFNALLPNAKSQAPKRNLSITGSVFTDFNANGTQDTGDPAASKATVFIDANNNGVLDKGERKALTNSKGSFSFKKLAAGTYTVRIVPGSTQIVTDPFSGSYSITLTSGVAPTTATFGLADKYWLTPKVTQYNLSSTTNVANIIAGPDGNLYFNMPGQNAIGQITTAGVVTQFTIPAARATPNDLTIGSDGLIWFTATGTNSIDSVTTAGVFGAAIPIPTSNSSVFDITTGPDGNVWFTEALTNKIGTVRDGAITEYSIPTSNSVPTDIAAGSGNALWFVELSGDAIANITIAGVVSQYPLPSADGTPQELTLGPDGNIWFTLQSPAGIGKMTPAGDVTVYPITSSMIPPGTNSAPHGIDLASDGTIYFTDAGASAIGQVNTSGQITESLLPTIGTDPINIAQASNGSLWFAESGTNQIGELASGNDLTISKSHARKSTKYDVADFGDRDPNASIKEYKATINWGDGTTTAGKVAAGADSLFEVLGAHNYANTGTFNITVLIDDESGADYTASGTATVTS